MSKHATIAAIDAISGRLTATNDYDKVSCNSQKPTKEDLQIVEVLNAWHKKVDIVVPDCQTCGDRVRLAVDNAKKA